MKVPRRDAWPQATAVTCALLLGACEAPGVDESDAAVSGSGGASAAGGARGPGGSTFFEGPMTSGNPSDATDDLIQANIVAAGYGH